MGITVTGGAFGGANVFSSDPTSAAAKLGALYSLPTSSHSSTSFTFTTGVGSSLTFTGSGFGAFDANGVPHQGTIVDVVVTNAGALASTWQGMSLDAQVFWNYVTAAHNGDANAAANLATLAFAGDDHFIAASGGGSVGDTFLGLGGNDTFDMTNSAPGALLAGGDGNDVFTFGADFAVSDRVDGGAGTDTVALNGGGTSVYYAPLGGLAHGLVLGPATLTNVEAITLAAGSNYGLTFADANVALGATLTVDGSAVGASNSLYIDGSHLVSGGALDLIGGAGPNVLIGGSGADTLVGGGGNDALNGGAGGDTASYANATAGLTVSLAVSGAQNTGGAGTDTLTSIENLIGSNYNDVLTARASGSSLHGGAGQDVLVSGPGNDALDGGAGNDTAVYSGNYSAYTVTPSGGGYTVSGPDGTDTLTNIEILKFSDRQLVLGHSAETLTLQAGDFNGDGVSDFLIENTSGAVFVGEAQNGQVGYTQVAGLGPEWSFHGSGDFLGNGDSDFLIQNTGGSVAVGEVHNGQTSYTTVAGLGPEWSFRGTGDFLGDGKSDFLIENASGVVVVGEVASGQAQYTAVAGLGPEWSFRGAGDFLGHGKSDFLIQNTAGVVAVGEVVSGQAQYTAIAGLGPEWTFKETGDFLGDGKDDFLIENTAGSVVIGEVVSGQAQYTAIAGLGPEWKFVGAGDYLGEGHDQFLIENSSGAIDIGDWSGGQVHFTNIAGLGPEWVFH